MFFDFYYLIGGVALVVIVLIVVVVSKGKRANSPNLVLEEFSFDENKDEFLNIKGRSSGFWSWVLSLFNKASITSFTCDKQQVKYEVSNFKYNIPIMNISCVSSGMSKPSPILRVIGIIGGIFTSLGLIGLLLSMPFLLNVFPIGIALLILFFAFNRKAIHFGIYIGENKPMVTITMKKGIIDSIDTNKFESAANALNKAVLAIKAK